jgi:two-component system, OmpR family, phosphate regulon sensor histidine kinase PhoR
MPSSVHHLLRQKALDIRSCSLSLVAWRSHAGSEPAATGSERDFLSVLLAMAGHDLRQPLQIITSAHDVLATMVDDGEQREELARAADATSSLATMLSQIVEALQLHELPSDHASAVVFLEPLLEELQREFSWTAQSKDIRLTIVPTRAAVHSHPVLLRAILRSLVRNAVDYTQRGGRVTVSCRRAAASLRIEVQDSGVGISSAALPRIFRAFERADHTRADGLGLGLFIAKRAAGLLNHRMHVRSLPGHGSCFSVDAEAAPVPRTSLNRTDTKTVRQPISRRRVPASARRARTFGDNASAGSLEHAIVAGKEDVPAPLLNANHQAHSGYRAEGLLATG